jgi:pimeloyl-ACP methyl ester carboxylesterase
MTVATIDKVSDSVDNLMGDSDALQSHQIELNDVSLHYVKAVDTSDRTPLLILHGLSGSLAKFLHLAPQLMAEADPYFLDMRGHGLSGHARDGYRVKDYVRDAVAFIDDVLGQPPIILAHSLGGVVAAWIAADYPDKLRGLIIEDAPLYIMEMPAFAQTIFYPYFTDLYRHLRSYHARGAQLASMIKYVGEAPLDGTRTVFDVAGPDAVRDRAIQLHQMDPAVIRPALAVVRPELGETLMGDRSVDDLLRNVRCPVHLIAADYPLGGALPAADLQRAISLMPHSSHAIIRGAGHDIHLDRPDAFVEQLVQFMDSLK